MKPPTISTLSAGLFGSALLAAAMPFAGAVELTISGNPTLSGSGPALEARFHNVATVDGNNVDLHGKILSQSTNKTNEFYAQGDDFVFEFHNGEDGEDRWATVQWTLYQSGTTTPVSVEALALTIDDLDHYWSRTESIETGDAISYTVNQPTNLAVSFTGGNLTATGGANQSTGDPESAVTLYIDSGSAFTITYRCQFHADADAGFTHDADGDFVFTEPLTRLFYTYHFTNNEDHAIPAGFSDTLPAGLTWDTDFSAILSGNVTGSNILYQDGDTTARVVGMIMHPGSGSLTLCTMGTTQPGVIYNEATIEPDEPGAESLTANATVVLP